MVSPKREPMRSTSEKNLHPHVSGAAMLEWLTPEVEEVVDRGGLELRPHRLRRPHEHDACPPALRGARA